MRGCAALAVLLGHWRNLVFVDFGQVPAHGRVLLMPFYLLCSGGHQAVVIFFVLSGYLISGSIFRMLERGQWSWRTYGLHRIVRLWMVLLPGLLLCALWDRIGVGLHLAPALYHGTADSHIIPDVASASSLKIFFENLFFLQTITGPNFGSDTSLWSLANEAWYYLMFPLALLACRRGTSWLMRALFTLLLALSAWFVGGILISFPIWLAGVVLARLPVARLSAWVRVATVVVSVPIFVLAGAWDHVPWLPPFPAMIRDYVQTALTVGLLWVLLSATQPATGGWGERASRGLARFSFTLYVSHVPLCALLFAVLSHGVRWVPDLPHLAMGFGLLAVVLLYCYALASVTEFHTDQLRRAIERRVLRKPALLMVT